MRINARLDQEIERKLKYLLEATNHSATEVIKKAIDLYYSQVKRNQRHQATRALEKAGFIGCGSAPSDLSTNYKEALTRGLKGKT